MKEYKIGERFELGGMLFEVVAQKGCKECAFAEQCLEYRELVCINTKRIDGKDVIFRRVPELTLDQYQRQAMDTNTKRSQNFDDMAFGVIAASVNIADLITKYKREGVMRIGGDRLVFNPSKPDKAYTCKTEMTKEIGDVLWFVAGLSDALGFTLDEIARMSLDK